MSYSAHNEQYAAVVSGVGALYSRIAPEIGGKNTTLTIFNLRKK
jgi:hypothetical protein